MRPKPKNLTLRLLLDEGVPDSVGREFEERGHIVIYGNKKLARGSPDPIVCTAALQSDAILVAADHDMKSIARRNGVSGGRFKGLSLIKLSCRKPDAAERVRQAMSLIEHEWEYQGGTSARRINIEIQKVVIRTERWPVALPAAQSSQGRTSSPESAGVEIAALPASKG